LVEFFSMRAHRSAFSAADLRISRFGLTRSGDATGSTGCVDDACANAMAGMLEMAPSSVVTSITPRQDRRIGALRRVEPLEVESMGEIPVAAFVLLGGCAT